jgi:1-acyl-sn-glycerol-3-phosphate acyltransferase
MTTIQPTRIEIITNQVIKSITILLSDVHAPQFDDVPNEGPFIVATNHINFLEAPIIYTRLAPRPVTGFAKIETWDNAFLGWLFDVWGVIPLNRGEADKTAIKAGLKALKEGYFLAIAPEGTRNPEGSLGLGHPGIVLMALLSGAPILPIVHYGHQNYKEDFKKLKRTKFHAVVGHPFHLIKNDKKITSEIRQVMTSEIMYQISALLPPAHRGEYSDLSKATETYLWFTPPATSNLLFARE